MLLPCHPQASHVTALTDSAGAVAGLLADLACLACFQLLTGLLVGSWTDTTIEAVAVQGTAKQPHECKPYNPKPF